VGLFVKGQISCGRKDTFNGILTRGKVVEIEFEIEIKA
jgi:hypothetical protein